MTQHIICKLASCGRGTARGGWLRAGSQAGAASVRFGAPFTLAALVGLLRAQAPRGLQADHDARFLPRRDGPIQQVPQRGGPRTRPIRACVTGHGFPSHLGQQRGMTASCDDLPAQASHPSWYPEGARQKAKRHAKLALRLPGRRGADWFSRQRPLGMVVAGSRRPGTSGSGGDQRGQRRHGAVVTVVPCRASPPSRFARVGMVAPMRAAAPKMASGARRSWAQLQFTSTLGPCAGRFSQRMQPRQPV